MLFENEEGKLIEEGKSDQGKLNQGKLNEERVDSQASESCAHCGNFMPTEVQLYCKSCLPLGLDLGNFESVSVSHDQQVLIEHCIQLLQCSKSTATLWEIISFEFRIVVLLQLPACIVFAVWYQMGLIPSAVVFVFVFAAFVGCIVVDVNSQRQCIRFLFAEDLSYTELFKPGLTALSLPITVLASVHISMQFLRERWRSMAFALSMLLLGALLAPTLSLRIVPITLAVIGVCTTLWLITKWLIRLWKCVVFGVVPSLIANAGKSWLEVAQVAAEVTNQPSHSYKMFVELLGRNAHKLTLLERRRLSIMLRRIFPMLIFFAIHKSLKQQSRVSIREKGPLE